MRISRTAAIMQPTYLPWLGYFDMIDQADIFVFLDTVEYNSGSWQQRNRIKGPHGAIWLTVPTRSTGEPQRIEEVEIDTGQRFVDEHLKTIHHSYANAEHYDGLVPEIEEILRKGHRYLADLTTELIEHLADELGIQAKFAASSDLEVAGSKGDLLVEVCKAVGADRYLSAQGSRAYLEDDNPFPDNDIDLVFHEIDHPSYQQRFDGFVSHLSVIDLLFNVGPGSLEIIRSGRSN